MEKITLNVEGMSCSHCEKTIKKAVGELVGVTGVNVDLAQKTVTIEYEPVKANLENFKLAIEEEGYEVVG
ncbi:copper ion binding protein [Acetobacterium bakii]|uniref:HMA domain-containing protein n=1 Tax=Acetobacterium bakii TaxID=52689 RepID=A0A0L6U4I6_9FIRM|nr:copper ion binding protein [Acetobacterium bakii]KNZ43421.1 hypothetical protein AKG39_01610 [Acetobacterium bakii]